MCVCMYMDVCIYVYMSTNFYKVYMSTNFEERSSTYLVYTLSILHEVAAVYVCVLHIPGYTIFIFHDVADMYVYMHVCVCVSMHVYVSVYVCWFTNLGTSGLTKFIILGKKLHIPGLHIHISRLCRSRSLSRLSKL